MDTNVRNMQDTAAPVAAQSHQAPSHGSSLNGKGPQDMPGWFKERQLDLIDHIETLSAPRTA